MATRAPARRAAEAASPHRDPADPTPPSTPPASADSGAAARSGPSIGVRLVALVLLALLPTVGVVLVLADSWRSASEADAAAGVVRLAEAAAVHQEHLLRSTTMLLEALADTTEVRDRAACTQFLSEFHDDRPEFGVLGVADASGDFWCSSRPTPGPISVADRGYFIELRDTGQPAMGRYQIGRVIGRPVVAMGHPLTGPDGEFAGAVIASLELTRPVALAERLHLPEGSLLTVFDGDGTILVHWPTDGDLVGSRDHADLAAQRPGTAMRLVGPDGIERIYGAARLHEHAGALTLTVGVPVAAVDTAVNATLRSAGLALLGIGALAAGGALWVGRRWIVLPAHRLIDIARRLAGGDLTARSRTVGGGEFGALAHEFDQMAEALQEREQELRAAEQRAVEERYRGLLDIAADAVLVVDRAGRIVLCNQGAEELFGMAPDVARGQHLTSLIGDDLSAGERTEVAWTDDAGAVRWGEATSSTGSDGLTTVILRDVTARHEAAAAAEALRESQERFRLAQQHSAIGMAIVAPDGRWLEVNPALCTIVGRSEQELLELTFQDITHPDDLDTDLAHLERLLSGEDESYELEKRYLHADGHVVWIQLNVSVVRDAVGRPNYLVAQVQDLTERKKSQDLLDLLFRTSPDLLAIADLDGRFIRVNPAWTELLGWSRDELLSRPYQEFVHPDDLVPTRAEHEQVMHGTWVTHRFENRWRTVDGEDRWLQWNALRMPDVGLIIAIARDVTAQRTQQAELEQHRADLARSNAELEQFAYVASHDLQQPLRMVASFLQLLERRLGTDLDDDSREYLRYAVDGATRMQQLINDLLAYSRVGTGGGTPESCALDEILAEVRDDLKVAIEETGATVDAAPLPSVVADRGQVRQLLMNLVGNALKFHRPGERPAVRLYADREGDHWVVSVADDGIGIPAHQADRIFEVFQRLHTVDEYGGTGIGLAICKKIVERHGGRIWVESGDPGATFRFTLPTS